MSIRLDLVLELATELAFVPSDRLSFLTQDRPYKPETLGNSLRDQCTAAGVPGSAHGRRKASATRLANDEATPDEIRGFLGHKTNNQGSTYTEKADRGRLADKLDKKGG
ncbi:hypothetical protein OEW28_11580 [Defluviimonas sp. WL0002]|uniref:Phage integrase family protein n=1 Tax=Albidovulum marisflavi TaxID=2984159 RepID=A0ABT2ZDR3_9RHOB|nr:hypothetical protein [Defluviimonas sp. WL0002]MCV2869267.1 hypothetical protein [Defluviimonas sp. WL0002]